MPRKSIRADVERINQVLAGCAFPAAKWQLIMCAEEYGADADTRAQLWTLAPATYRTLGSVLGALGLRPRSLRGLARRAVSGPAR